MPSKKWFPVILLAGTYLMTSCRAHSPEERAEWVSKRIVSQLDLDAAQQTKLAAVKTEWVAFQISQREIRRGRLSELSAAIESGKLDAARVTAMMDDGIKAMRKESPRLIALVSDLNASLNAAQRATLAKKIEQLKEGL